MAKCTYCGKVWEEPIVTSNEYFICSCGTLVDIGYGLPDMNAQPYKVEDWVKDFVEDGKTYLEIGMITKNPKTGKTVKITRGQFWGKYGLSNFWFWREVLENGELSEVEESGYGWEVESR